MSDAASSSERKPACCLSLFVEVMLRVSKISCSSLCLGKKKKTQLETNIKFLFLSDTKLISLHLGIDKPAAKQGEKKKKKTGKKRAFLVDK